MSTFSRPANMMDHVESHLRKEPAETIACHHPVCKAEGLVLNSVMHFKNHVARVHEISLRLGIFPSYSFHIDPRSLQVLFRIIE